MELCAVFKSLDIEDVLEIGIVFCHATPNAVPASLKGKLNNKPN